MLLRKLKLLFYQAIIILGLYFLTQHLKEEGKDPRYFLISGAFTVIFAIISITDLLRGPWKKS
jgi:hypothetical protein